jgi:hypothetical protein
MNRTKVVAVLALAYMAASYADVAPTPAPPPPAAPIVADCSNLSADEQQFAAQLSAPNKAIFCGQLTPAQRMAAMQMVRTPDATGAMLTPDQAVQRVAPAPAPAPSSQPQNAGGCPVQ